MQADMPIPTVISPIPLPRQASPAYPSKPALTTNITASATLQTANPVITYASNSGPVVAGQQYSSTTSTVTAQNSGSSTATAAVLASLRQQQQGAGMQADGVGPSSEAQQQSALEPEEVATTTSRR